MSFNTRFAWPSLVVFIAATCVGCGGDSPSTANTVDGGGLTSRDASASVDLSADVGPCGTGDKAILADGTTVVSANLAIVSDNNTESGVAAINGGHVTLSDSSITKSNDGLCGGSGAATTSDASSTPASGGVPGVSSTGAAPASGAMPGDPFEGGLPPNGDMPGDPFDGGLPPNGDMPGDPFDGGAFGGMPPDGGMGPGGSSPEGSSGGGDSTAAVGANSSGVYVGSNSTATLSNLQISTALEEGKALCATGSGAAITLTKGTISTTGDSSHGAFATQGGSIKLTDVNITTAGQHCSTLATDQGGGTVIAEGGTFVAKGEYSAGIYSTGDIRATNASFEAQHDRVACMEGGSRITLTNCSLVAATKDAVIIYQSFSGDSTVGVSEFTMTGGSITGKAADLPLFYVTNTHATISLTGVKLTSASGLVLRALKGAWMDNPPNGAVPTQGGSVTFTVNNLTLPGDIELDEDSSITAIFKDQSTMEGSIDASGKGKAMSLTLDGSSSWEVTADSHLTALTLASASSISAPAGKSVLMTVDGVPTPITAGAFEGAIVLTVQ